jgi:hypothetical protein
MPSQSQRWSADCRAYAHLDVVELVLGRCDQVRPHELSRRDRLHVEICDRLLSIGAVRVEHADARAPANRCGPDAALENR